MKIGCWHQGIVGKGVQTDEKTFATYASQYVKFIKDNNIQRAFFILKNPNEPYGHYAKQKWVVKYWLNQLPTNCEAGFVLDTEPTSSWSNSPIFTAGDSMDIAFQYISDINNDSNNHKISCVGFDSEDVGGKWEYGYYSTRGISWINQLVSKYINVSGFDWGFAGQSSHANQLNKYREVYWVDELKDCGCTGPVAKVKGKQCQCPNTPYCVNKNNPTGILNTSIGKYLKSPTLNQPNIWPMFSVESASNLDCVAMPEAQYAKHPCGLVDAFGVWDKDEFFKFLNQVGVDYNIQQAMIYEWQFIPKTWL